MKKRILALALALILLLTACATAPTPPSYAQNVEVDGTSIRVGQYRTEIPESFSVYDTNDSTVILMSTELRCIVSLFAFNASEMSEDDIRLWLDGSAPDKYGVLETDTSFAGMDMEGHLWVELDDDMQPQTSIQTNFTDSWYVYQTTTVLMPGSDVTDALSESIRLLMFFEADGVKPRFDFVQ